MQRDHLGSQEVLARRNALRDLDALAAFTVDDALRAPHAVGVHAVLLDLEPAVADAAVGGRVVDLFQVGNGRALVRAVHDVRGGVARRAEHVPPDGRHVAAGLHGDYLGGGADCVGRAVAGDGGRGDVLDRTVVGRHADALAEALVDAADLEGGEDGVGAGGAGEDERGEDLHGDTDTGRGG